MARLGVALGPDDAGARATSARSRPTSTASCSQLGPFSQAADPGARSALGDGDRRRHATRSSQRGRSSQDLGALRERRAAAVGATCKSLTVSLRDTGGIERAMDYIFYQVAAINGFDSVGHYLRAGADRQHVLDVRDHARRRTARRTSRTARRRDAPARRGARRPRPATRRAARRRGASAGRRAGRPGEPRRLDAATGAGRRARRTAAPPDDARAEPRPRRGDRAAPQPARRGDARPRPGRTTAADRRPLLDYLLGSEP